MRKYGIVLAALCLSACLEPQPKPEVMNLNSGQFQIQTISDELNQPWGVGVLPDRSYLVTEFNGALKQIKKGKATEITGLPEDLFVNGQGGFMGVALSPNFRRNREVFFSYSYGNKSKNGTGVYKAKLKGNELIDGTVIFRSSAKDTGSHFGGQMVFLPDGSLILTLGDGFAYREKAQELDTHLGKIVRIDTDGKALPDNPFFETENARPEIYSYGHRNVQGLAYDKATQTLWSHEHGPRGGDELNNIKAGSNYGWPLATTGTDYNGAKITPFKTYRGTQAFVYDWVPSIAPSGLAIYQGNKFPEWKGDALVGALADRSLWRIDLEAGQAIGKTRMLGDMGHRIRGVGIDRDGAVLVLTEADSGGSLLRVLPKP